MKAQIIEKDGKPEWAIIPYSEYQKLYEALEDAEDLKDIEKHLDAIQQGTETLIPGEITFAVLDGISPIRAWREHKQIKMNKLAKKVGISSAYLSQIENGKRNPTIDTLKAIATGLDIEVEMLI
ncbi:MAG: helix-turn-helix transcriptional regulator [Desulfobacterales bacterium]|nr:helix-turn-helix transcriptional regulator [Desulfobacterales bacterium]